MHPCCDGTGLGPTSDLLRGKSVKFSLESDPSGIHRQNYLLRRFGPGHFKLKKTEIVGTSFSIGEISKCHDCKKCDRAFGHQMPTSDITPRSVSEMESWRKVEQQLDSAMAKLDDVANEIEGETPLVTAEDTGGRPAHYVITTPRDQRRRNDARSCFRSWIDVLHGVKNMPPGIRKRWGG